MKIKNLDSVVHTWCGQTVQPNASYTVQWREAERWGRDTQVAADVVAGKAIILEDSSADVTVSTGCHVLTSCSKASTSFDKNGTNQTITGTDWTEISVQRVLWDTEGDYDENYPNDFVVPYDGAYLNDGQFRVTELGIGVTSIEIALFKRGDPDDYWFTSAYVPQALLSPINQMSTATMYDMHTGEKFCFKIRLTGILPSAVISGNDDYTAWGFSFTRVLIGDRKVT